MIPQDRLIRAHQAKPEAIQMLHISPRAMRETMRKRTQNNKKLVYALIFIICSYLTPKSEDVQSSHEACCRLPQRLLLFVAISE
jgi:hypothetical protein